MVSLSLLQGSWKPSWNISTLLTSIQLLMSDPNPDDPLMADIVSSLVFTEITVSSTVQQEKQYSHPYTNGCGAIKALSLPHHQSILDKSTLINKINIPARKCRHHSV